MVDYELGRKTSRDSKIEIFRLSLDEILVKNAKITCLKRQTFAKLHKLQNLTDSLAVLTSNTCVIPKSKSKEIIYCSDYKITLVKKSF